MAQNTPFGHNEEEDFIDIDFIEDIDQYLFSEEPYIEKEDEDDLWDSHH